MRLYLVFLALLAGALVLAAAITYPAWLLVSEISVQPVHRVMHRAAMLFALVGLVYLTRRHALADRASLGFALPARAFTRQLVIGWLCGFALMSAFSGLLLSSEVRHLRPDVDLFAPTLLLGAVLTGLTVALIEETFFRGVLFTAVNRGSGLIAAIAAPSVLYAALHFLGGKLRVPPEEVSWIHGLEVLAKLFERYSAPMELIDSFAALFTLGVLLSLVRWRTGSIAACIGLHAAGVAFIALLRHATVVNPEAEYGWLVGSYDGVIGWAAFVCFALMAVIYSRWPRPAAPG